ncbi:MAG: flagellar hook capping FlgD N-terminal domain-containing protein [Bacillota bacterium]
MAIDSVGGVGSPQATGGSQKTQTAGTVGALQDQFMKILLTQLQYQDPMAPMEEKDFFGQMAQFTAATEMGNLNTKMDLLLASMGQSQVSQSLLSAAKLIGNSFTAVTDKGLVEGVVEAVTLCDGRVHVKSGDMLVPVEDLLAIGVAADAS